MVVRRLLASPYPVRALLGVPRRFDELAADLAATHAPFFIASPDVMASVVGFHLNRGVLAVADRPAFPSAAGLIADSAVLAVLEGVGDHENLGGLFRNAAGLGVDGVLVGPGCADPLYRRSVRVSMGTVLMVPFAVVADPMVTLADMLRRNGFRVAALSPSGEVSLRDADLAPPVALLLGSEGPGLSATALGAADVRVRIPMSRGVDSLNLATAAAIAFAAIRR